MIYVIATLNIKPGSAEKVFAAAMPYLESTRAEPGCISFDLSQAVDDENKLIFVERWKTREDLDLHFKQPHMAVWRENGGPYITSRKIEVIHVDKVEEL